MRRGGRIRKRRHPNSFRDGPVVSHSCQSRDPDWAFSHATHLLCSLLAVCCSGPASCHPIQQNPFTFPSPSTPMCQPCLPVYRKPPVSRWCEKQDRRCNFTCSSDLAASMTLLEVLDWSVLLSGVVQSSANIF